MIVRIEDNKIIVEFPLTQSRAWWKIRSKVRRDKRGFLVPEVNCYVFTPRIGDYIYQGDVLEWMVTNDEIRDILFALKCISIHEYEKIRTRIYRLTDADFVNWAHRRIITWELGHGIQAEALLRGKQRKPEELTPYFMVLFPLYTTSSVHYLVDMRGKRIERPVGYRIRAGDRLLWIPAPGSIESIISLIAILSKDHYMGVKSEVFDVVEQLEC